MPLDWITTNGARAAFQQDQQFEQQQELNALRLREAQRQDAKGAALASSEIEAGQAQNARTVFETDTARKIQPDLVRNSASGAAMNETRANQAQYDFDESRERRGLRDVQARTAQGQAETAGQDTDLQKFVKIAGFIEAGQPGLARQAAQAYGQDLPDDVLNDMALGAEVKELAAYAERAYPGRPASQQKYMQAGIEAIQRRRTQPKDVRPDPTAPYQVQGAPAPADTAGREGRQTDFQIKVEAAKAIGKTDEEAFEIAMGRRPASDNDLIEMSRKIMAAEMPTSDINTTPEDRRRRQSEILQQLRGGTFGVPPQGGTAAPEPGEDEEEEEGSSWYNPFSWGGGDKPAPAAAPASLVPGSSAGEGATMPAAPRQGAPQSAAAPQAAAPAAAAQRPATLQGAGTEAEPFNATGGNADLQWFKTNAQSGAVLTIFDPTTNKVRTFRKP